MLDRMANGWKLLKLSFGILFANPRLLLFPAATAVLTLFIGGLFMAPIALQPTESPYMSSQHWKEVGSRLIVRTEPTMRDRMRGRDHSVRLSGQAMSYFVIFYFLSMFLAVFFNVAFVHEIFDALDGNNVSVAEGIAFAMTKLKPILAWTLFAGLIGLAIKALEEKVGFFGKWVVRMLGAAWSVAAVFVVPILVVEEVPTPIDAIKRSAGLITKTWGEALAGYAGLQLAGPIVLLTMPFLGFGMYYSAVVLDSMKLMAVVFGLWLAGVAAFSYAVGVAGQIYLCVLYRYAANGQLTAGFTADALGASWKRKA